MSIKKQVITIIDAPHVSLAENEKAGEALLKFFRALGWNGADYLDPSKVRTTKDVYDRLCEVMYDRCLDPVSVGMLMLNRGPGTDDHVQPGKVHLLDGWITPVESREARGVDVD